MREITLQHDSTGQGNMIIRMFIILLFNAKSFTECIRDLLTEINAFFRIPDNHLEHIPYSLTDIYNNYIKNKCAQSIISSSAKYVVPKLAALNATPPSDTLPSPQSEDLNDFTINAARFRTSLNPDRNSSDNPYVLDRCKVCGLTQKELHAQLKAMHDPNNRLQCCLRSHKFIPEKHIREYIMQYNFKHPCPLHIIHPHLIPPTTTITSRSICLFYTYSNHGEYTNPVHSSTTSTASYQLDDCSN